MNSDDLIVDKLYSIEKELKKIKYDLHMLGYWDISDNIKYILKKIEHEIESI